MNFINMNITYRHILWRQVWGLAVLLAAILFSWMAYGFYQPIILTKLGFIELAQSLSIIQGFLGAAIEPLVGKISDRLMHRIGSRLPIIAVGVTLAGLLFVAIGLLLHGYIPIGLRWIIPVLMTFWVVSMIIFRGPVIALIRQFAPIEALPIANSILTLVFGLVGALGPIFGRIIEILGAVNTFLFGAMMLIVGTVLLWSTDPHLTIDLESRIPISATNLAVGTRKVHRWPIQQVEIFGIGSIAGLVVNILLRICPQKLSKTLPDLAPEYIAAGMLFICAIAAIPLGWQVEKWGVNRSMIIGIVSISIAIGASSIFDLSGISIAIVLFGGIAMGLLFIAQIPWCLGRLSDRQTGLSTGLYFGGMGAATAILGLIIQSGIGA
jgi:Na+/melibiose symporter-like transporter